jgi:predicted O-methyltransferase YrrM
MTHAQNTIIDALYRQPSYTASEEFVKGIALQIERGTFHHHFHILWPLLECIGGTAYLEIGCYSGASLITALQHADLRRAVSLDTFGVWPDQQSTVKRNLDRFAQGCGTKVELVCGSSHDRSLIASMYHALLKDPTFFGFDLLFIDGDHSFQGVLDDFEFFHNLVNPGGLIVFDDYADVQHSPAVRRAVDAIVARHGNSCTVHGQPDNRAEAFGNGLTGLQSNEFILQRAPFSISKAKYIVCIATYYRANGTTNQSLRRILAQLEAQTERNWFALVIGDNYTNRAEFDALADCLPAEKSCFINLPVGGERENSNINIDRRRLWHTAGMTAINYSLMLCQKFAPNSIYVHADDDDTWQAHHLQTLDEVYQMHPRATFVGTIGRFAGGVFPRSVPVVERPPGAPVATIACYPLPNETLHSSVSWKVKDIPLRYDVGPGATDAIMWQRMTEYMKANGLEGYLAQHVTMAHPTEQGRVL